jgi:hypothetical protein
VIDRRVYVSRRSCGLRCVIVPPITRCDCYAGSLLKKQPLLQAGTRDAFDLDLASSEKARNTDAGARRQT